MPNEAEMNRKYMAYLSAHERWVSALENDPFAKGAPGKAQAMEDAWSDFIAHGGTPASAIHGGAR